jgi:hypothetical protein
VTDKQIDHATAKDITDEYHESKVTGE